MSGSAWCRPLSVLGHKLSAEIHITAAFDQLVRKTIRGHCGSVEKKFAEPYSNKMI